jgi:hypothetical protein
MWLFEIAWNEFFSIYVVLPAAPVPGVYSASNRIEYQMQKHNVSGELIAAGARGSRPYRLC